MTRRIWITLATLGLLALVAGGTIAIAQDLSPPDPVVSSTSTPAMTAPDTTTSPPFSSL